MEYKIQVAINQNGPVATINWEAEDVQSVTFTAENDPAALKLFKKQLKRLGLPSRPYIFHMTNKYGVEIDSGKLNSSS